jgi:hypothetical protein
MDTSTLIFALDFTRNRLLGTLDTIEKTARERGHDMGKVLAWRPGPGRAHIGWQAMHCAATHDKYLNVTLLGKAPKDEALVKNFGGGSTPSDENVPGVGAIRDALGDRFASFKRFVAGLDAAGLARSIPGPNNTQRTVGESITLLAWHEAHHQGQIHLTWNLYKGAHGIG